MLTPMLTPMRWHGSGRQPRPLALSTRTFAPGREWEGGVGQEKKNTHKKTRNVNQPCSAEDQSWSVCACVCYLHQPHWARLQQRRGQPRGAFLRRGATPTLVVIRGEFPTQGRLAFRRFQCTGDKVGEDDIKQIGAKHTTDDQDAHRTTKQNKKRQVFCVYLAASGKCANGGVTPAARGDRSGSVGATRSAGTAANSRAIMSSSSSSSWPW